MVRDVDCLIRPRSVAVVGASASRRAQGNGVIRNLLAAGYGGRIFPVHSSAKVIEDQAAVPAIADLPDGIDTAVVAIPAGGVVAALGELERAGVRSAMVFSNGFAESEETDFRAFGVASGMAVHGPNCMGLINFSDGIRLYPSTITDKVQLGKVALIAQSGSAAISLMNSTSVGLSKVITMGSEFQIAAPDYMRWLAGDETTAVVGVVLESIRDPADFAAAADLLRAAGKALVVLKVGRSAVGAVAVAAHTGALISRSEAYDRFLARHGIAVARDYDELIATVECFATCRRRPRGGRVGVVGISGGETALACDIIAELGMTAATWSSTTGEKLRAALPGVSGVNPLDLGASVHHALAQDEAAIAAILEDDGVDQLLVVQDAQATLTPIMLGNYTPRIEAYGRLGGAAEKPVVIVSPTGENTHPWIMEAMAAQGVPVLRGLRAGVVALRNLGVPGAEVGRVPVVTPGVSRFADEVAGCHGPLAGNLCGKILAEFGIPMVRSVVVTMEEEALEAARRIGFPLVVKIASPDVPHRTEVGGVVLDVADAASLVAAMAQIRDGVLRACPGARIAGFELQEQLTGWVEAAAGFIAAPPFGALMMVGSGGVLVELEADRAVELCPIWDEQAGAMIRGTRLGTRLGGYRGLIAQTDPAKLADLLVRLGALAAALSGQIAACDLNPVLIRVGSGEVRVADVLMVAAKRSER